MAERWLRLILLGLSISLNACIASAPSTQPSPSVSSPSPSEKKLEYNLHKLPRSIVHTLKIPAQSQFIVSPEIASNLKTVEEFAVSSQAIAAINGGFFDPENQKSTSAVIQNGQQVAKPEDNERVMSNLDLLPYLDKILNRSEFRRYRCGAMLMYDIARRQQLPPTNCQLSAALGAGPQLLPFMSLKEEGFWDGQADRSPRDPLGYNQPNARSAIGLAPDGSVILVLAAQRPDVNGPGLSLPELADFMKKIGIEKGLNLDGGTSSALHFQGETFYGKVNADGEPVSRSVNSVLLIQSIKKPEK